MARQSPKCCCCVPLRPGLLAWAYIKLVLAFIFIGLYFYKMGPRLEYSVRYMSREIYTFQELLSLVACLPYLVFTIIFIIGVHRQNSKLLRLFLVYSVFEVMIAVGAVGWQVYVTMQFLKELSFYHLYQSEEADKMLYEFIHDPYLYLQIILLVVVNMLLPIYLIVLIKSEVQRLKKARGETRVVLDDPVKKEQGRKYYFVDETPDLRKPLFPVEELKRLRQQLGVKNV